MRTADFIKATVCGVSIWISSSAALAFDLLPLIADAPSANDATLVADGRAAMIYVDADDFAVVRKTADLFADDVERVSHVRPSVAHRVEDLHGAAVIVGTVGHSAAIDALVAAKKLDVTAIRGQWERFAIQTVDAPFPGVARAIVIVGSDRRGTAFGTLELSEQIGVSPWYWWADVAPQSHASLAVKSGTYLSKPPAVRYRGIFINDEDWGLKPWAAKTFDPAFGNIGPKTYARVFELLLRLKANYLWPAMHNCSTEFGSVPENVQLADDWGIVMGASHCEPINRNNVWWDAKSRGEWRYDTNRDNVIQYWREWAQQRGKYEAVWTLGLRGIHDASIQHPSDLPGKVRVVSQAIADQRDLLKQYVNADVARVPQVFMPYKEALTQYRAGIEVPDDVTLVWCDDNFGFIRQLSSTKEQQRSGRSGVYYHLSYLGRPKPYTWLNTTSPALIYSEMSKALAFGADRAWVLNVGDIKPGEIGMDFGCRMAWDPTRFDADAQPTFLKSFATQQFGPVPADAIAKVLRDYYQLAAVRKPELMESNVFSVVNDGEATRTLTMARDLRARAEVINGALPPAMRDAFYELVLYPIRIQAAVTEQYIAADLNALAAMQGRAGEANAFAHQVDAAARSIDAETATFNDTLAGGKWKHLMFERGTDYYSNFLVWPRPVRPDATTTRPALRVAIEGQAALVGQTPAPRIAIAAKSGTLQPPWQVGENVGWITLPPSKQLADPDAAPQARFTFDVPTKQSLNLFVEAECPNDKSDSFFYRVDDGAWQTWANEPVGRSAMSWSRMTNVTLDAGSHALTIAQRESGIHLNGFRLTTDDSAQSPDEFYAGKTTDTLAFDRAGDDAPRGVSVDNPTADTTPSAPWIVVEKAEHTSRFAVHIDWSKRPATPEADGTIVIRAGDETKTIRVRAVDRGLGQTVAWSEATRAQPFVESDGRVSIVAAHFTRTTRNDTAWRSISGLGRSGEAILAWPPGAASDVRGIAPAEYDVVTSTAGPARLDVYVLPTHAVNAEHGARFAASIDDGKPHLVDFNEEGGPAGEMSARWALNVTRNVSVNSVQLDVGSPGRHTLKLWIVDPGVVVDKLVLDLGGVRPTECGPPESRQLAR